MNRGILALTACYCFAATLAFAYEPVTCRDDFCLINAGDYVEVALGVNEDAQSWAFADTSQQLEGMHVSRTGIFYWTPTYLQTGNITVTLQGFDADGTVVASEQIVIEVLPNDRIDWSSLKFVTTNEFAPSRNADMDGSASGPYSLDKLGSVYCKDGVTLNETIYFRGGLHTTVMGDNPAAIFCSGQDLDNPLVLTPWGNERPILSPKGTEAIKILGDFVTVDGFEVAGYNDRITLEEALAVWWDEDKPTTSEGHSIIAQGILAKGNGIVVKNNIVHSWPGNGIKVQGDLSSITNNIVFNSGYYSTRGVGGVMVEGLDDSAYAMPPNREFGTIVRDNVIFGNESRIISHVFSKGFSTLEIDEGSGINLQQNNGNYTRKYLVENNAILFNGKGPGLRAKDITFRNNTVVGNGFNLRIPSSAGVRVTKISTSGLAGIFNGDAGATAVLENNIISVPPKHEAIRIDDDSRTLACANNTVKGFFAVNAKNPLFPDPDNPDPSIFCSTEENRFIINSPVENEADNDFRPVSGEGGASQAIVEAASARLAEIGFSLQPSGFDIMSIHAYDEYIMPMINNILSTTPQGDGGVELVYKDGAGDEVFGVDLSDENFEDLATVEKVEFNWLGTRPEYKPGTRFNASYYQVIKLAPDDLFAVTGSVTPNNGGVVECSDISIRVTKTQRPLECNAVPSDGFFFSGWSGDCSGLTCSFDLVSSDIHVIATFAEISPVTYTVTPSAGTGGLISPSSPQTVEEGATTSFTLTPSSGYQIDAVGGTCNGALSGSTYTTAAVTQNCSVNATFSVTVDSDLKGLVYHWYRHSFIDAAVITRTSDVETKSVTDSQGMYTFRETAKGSYELLASRSLTDADTNRTITSADALAALKIAVGLNPNSDPDGDGPLEALSVSPYQLVAADMNQDGRVTSADALAILKVAVGLSDALEPSWKLVADAQSLWSTHSDKSNVFDASKAYLLTYPDQTHVNFAAILLGDVNASWQPQEGTESLDHDHFSEYSKASGAPLSLWGIRDSDEDGLSDEQEEALGTSLFDADTDADGVNDVDDAFPLDPDKSEDIPVGSESEPVLSASPMKANTSAITLVKPVLLRGDLNDWGEGDVFTQLEDGSYSLTKKLSRGTYTFKIATSDWAVMDLGAKDEGSRLIALDRAVQLIADSNMSFILEVDVESKLVFSVQHDRTGATVLNVGEFR